MKIFFMIFLCQPSQLLALELILLNFFVERVYLCIALLPETTDHLLIYDFVNLGRSRLVEDLKYFVDTLDLCKKKLHLSSIFSSLHVSQRGQPVQRRWYLTDTLVMHN